MQKLLLAAAVASIAAGIGDAAAQTYPSRPITVIVPFPAGGPTDTTARVITEGMRAALGQTLVIENVGGGGSTIGVARTVRASPDGYTVIVGNSTSHVGAPAIYPVQYDILRDLEPVALLPAAPTLIIGRPTLPANTVQELIAWLKANPGKGTAGTVGAGSSGHLSAIHFQKETGTRIQIVPYRGAAPAMQDVVSGVIDLRFAAEGSQSLPFLRNGQIKAFAVMAKSRWLATPDVPTIDEAGVPGLYLSIWNGLWAPRGTPKDVIDRLNRAVVAALADPAARRRIADQGQEIPSRDQQTPEALGAFHKGEIEKWWPVIKAANIKPE